MTRADAAAVELEAQAEAMGIHSRDCREGIAEGEEIFSYDCAGCARALRAYRDWEVNGEARAIELAYDARASLETELDAVHGM